MKILEIKYPTVSIELSNKDNIRVKVEAFLNRIAPDKHSPYKKILETEVFPKVFVMGDKLVWDKVLEITMCGGDTMWLPAEFGEAELKGETNAKPTMPAAYC